MVASWETVSSGVDTTGTRICHSTHRISVKTHDDKIPFSCYLLQEVQKTHMWPQLRSSFWTQISSLSKNTLHVYQQTNLCKSRLQQSYTCEGELVTSDLLVLKVIWGKKKLVLQWKFITNNETLKMWSFTYTPSVQWHIALLPAPKKRHCTKCNFVLHLFVYCLHQASKLCHPNAKHVQMTFFL